ncbi:nuclease [Acidipila sp. EB88]|uniref:nuclease n=1 Tax=Acidipila sp. EB88 TaxID=2305226 RepID=UPI000F5DF0A1|nr:nuclease [Acidipila sp. EB88]RRA48742.1 nuclease [Acidipila sp. EB88]
MPTNRLCPSSARVRTVVALLLFAGAAAPNCFGWGSDGHRIINRLAVVSLPGDVPAFLTTPTALAEIEYLGPEPDRWRSPAEPELSAEQAPDHFIDLEYADVLGPLPPRRYDFIEQLSRYRAAHPGEAAVETPEKVGMQPWQTEEVWERLKSGFREYRAALAKHEDTRPQEAAVLFYAGWLGHYVGDGSQPLHVTRDYNGWVEKENPHGYTTDHHIHADFETTFVASVIKPADVASLVQPLQPIGDEWTDYLAYLRHSASLTEQTYALEKAGGFNGMGTPEGKAFTAQRLAAGAGMLRDLIYAAWQKSAEPVPEYHHDAPSGPSGAKSPAGGN